MLTWELMTSSMSDRKRLLGPLSVPLIVSPFPRSHKQKKPNLPISLSVRPYVSYLVSADLLLQCLFGLAQNIPLPEGKF